MFIFGIFPLLQQPKVSSHFMLQLCANCSRARAPTLFPKNPLLHKYLKKGTGNLYQGKYRDSGTQHIAGTAHNNRHNNTDQGFRKNVAMILLTLLVYWCSLFQLKYSIPFGIWIVCPNVTTDGGLSVFSIQIAAGQQRGLHQVILSDCFDVLVYHNKRNCTLSIWVN